MGRIYPFDAYDQAAARIEEKYAQHSRMRGGSEEVYPPGGEGAGPGAQKAITGPREVPSGARPARKLPRQEVPEEDLYQFPLIRPRAPIGAVRWT